MSDSIRANVRVAAPVGDVWAAWTDPAHLANWFPDRATGSAVPGTTMTYEWQALGMALSLEVVEAVAESRLVLRARPPGLAAQTQVIELARDGGDTAVALTHSGLTDDDIRRGTESGWHIALQILKRYAERHFGSARLSAWMLGLAPARFERAYRCYTEADGLREWLARAGSIGGAGTGYRLELIDGGTMSGEVLARCAGREVALSWSEIEGVVAFRSFAAAPGALLVGANLQSWGVPEPQLVAPARALGAAVDRLVRALGGASASA